MKKRWIAPCFDETTVTTKKLKQENVIQNNSKLPKQISSNSSVWIEKYKPVIIDDLVIHAKKLDEIKQWCEKYVRNENCSKYLLLFGPSGSGKTTSLQVIAKSYGIKILEWITPLDREYNAECYTDEQFQSASNVFKTFLFKACRYPNLFSEQSYKLILVKDFPNIFLQTPSIFHDLLTDFSKTKFDAVVFVFNDESLTRKLFPDELKTKLNIETIHFNPVHNKAVIKCLKRIINLEQISKNTPITDLELENIYSQTGGDLRSAILKLYFNFVNPSSLVQSNNSSTSNENSSGFNRVKKKVKTDKLKKIITDKDDICDLFIGLGRVLYPKRESFADNGGYKFTHNPDDIAIGFLSQATNFTNFLQENYISRFSDINDIAKAAEKLSAVDCILKCGNYNNDVEELALATVNRALMVTNNHPIRSFKPFVRPQFYKTLTRKEIFDNSRHLFPTFQHHSPSDVILYMLPLANIVSPELSIQQKQFLNERSLFRINQF